MEMEKSKEKDPFQAAKEAEGKILKLQADVQHLKQRIQLSESEEKAETEENIRKLKDNKHRIKKLQTQIDELQIRLNKGLKGDEKIITRAFKQHSREIGILSRKSGKEAVDILDGKVLELIKRSNLLTHILHTKKDKLEKLKQDICHLKKDDKAEQSETAVRIRELENEYMKVEKNLMECQVINSKYKAIQEQLKKELAAYPKLLDELEDEYHHQQDDVERLTASEVLARDRRDQAREHLAKAESGATRARMERERIIGEFGKALKPRPTTADLSQRQSTELSDSEAAEEWRKLRAEQERELKKMKEAFEKIKSVIGISDIEEAESRFLSQRRTLEELTDLVNRAEERRHDLMEELEKLKGKKESMKGAELARPQVTLEEELREAKEAQEEQAKRALAAQAEQERVQKLSADVKSALWYQLQLMKKYVEEDEPVSPDVSLTDVVSKTESVVQSLLERLRDHDLSEIKKGLMEEQLLQKFDAVKLVPTTSSGRKAKQTDEEESSDDEDLEKKRNQQKKEAEIYAEMKKKQQGRGRMMML